MKPYVRNIETGALERAVRRRLSESDLAALEEAQSAVVSALDEPSLYLAASSEELVRVLRDGEVWGVFAGGQLAAAAALLPPGRGEGLDSDLGISPDSPVTAELDRYFVRPQYRQNGLGGELVRFIKRRAFALGARYLAATVSPRNAPSIAALVAHGGLRIRCARLKYGGKLRYIACAERCDDTNFTVFERFALDDVYGITRMLAHGYAGCALFRDASGVYLWLAK